MTLRLREGMSVHDFIVTLRSGPYTSYGCYPLFFVTADGAALSFASARANAFRIGRAIRDRLNDGWRVIACDVNWEDPSLFCDDTGQRIESAYAEDEVGQ